MKLSQGCRRGRASSGRQTGGDAHDAIELDRPEHRGRMRHTL